MTNTIGQREKLEAAVERLRDALDESGRDAAIGLHGEVYLAPEDATAILAALSSPPAGEGEPVYYVRRYADGSRDISADPQPWPPQQRAKDYAELRGMILQPLYARPPSPGVEKTGERETVAAILDPELFSGDPVREHRAASPRRVDLMKEQTLAKADEIILALSPTSGGGTGWKLVPVRPTGEMIEAYFRACERNGFKSHINASCAYEAMLSAAPSSPEDIGGLE